MKRRIGLLILGVMIGGLGSARAQQPPTLEVYKSPTCGCCSKWMDHLRQNGLAFHVHEVPDAQLPAFKAKQGVPSQVQSCHTALVAGYVIEGHVPAAAIRRILTERPAIRGLAAAGMPRGAPGMEVWGQPPQQYEVTAFDKQGQTRLFAKYVGTTYKQ